MCDGRCTEPSLDELFGDTATQLLMRRDGVRESDVRALLCELRDARAAASVATARERGASKCANRASDREENIVSSQSSDARTFPVRFI
jgi:hypothetical protein